MLNARMKPKLPESRKRGKAMSEEIVQQIKERMRLDRAFRHDLLASPWRVLQAYPLNEEEKHLFVVPNFSWMIENRLAGVSSPRSEDAIALLRNLGVQALLNLSEEPLPLDLLSKYQLRGEHLPVADFTAPTLDQVERALIIIDGFLAQELPVAVHCGAGLGRTGTILACYLVSQGSTAKEAIQQVRTKRPASIQTLPQKPLLKPHDPFPQQNPTI